MATDQSTSRAPIVTDLATLGWLAGIFDGEGCFRISRASPQKASRVATYALRVIIKMTHQPTVARVRSLLGGGSLTIEDLHRQGANTAYMVTWTGEQAAGIIRLVRPLLFTKAEEADLAIQFAGLKKRARDEETREIRESIYRKMRQAKSRNNCPPSLARAEAVD